MAKGDKSKRENALQRFFRETMGELRRVTWPTWLEARNLTVVVIIVLIIMALFLWGDRFRRHETLDPDDWLLNGHALSRLTRLNDARPGSGRTV